MPHWSTTVGQWAVDRLFFQDRCHRPPLRPFQKMPVINFPLHFLGSPTLAGCESARTPPLVVKAWQGEGGIFRGSWLYVFFFKVAGKIKGKRNRQKKSQFPPLPCSWQGSVPCPFRPRHVALQQVASAACPRPPDQHHPPRPQPLRWPRVPPNQPPPPTSLPAPPDQPPVAKGRGGGEAGRHQKEGLRTPLRLS